MSDKEFELDFNTIAETRKRMQEKQRTEAHVVDGDVVETEED